MSTERETEREDGTGEHPYVLRDGEQLLVGRAGTEIAVEPQDAIDLGSTLVALGKDAVASSASSWGIPEEQHRFLVASSANEDFLFNFAELALKAGDWRVAWSLGLVAVTSDHGRADDLGWTLVVGRSRRLELALQMRSFAEARALGPELEQDISYLCSRELDERLRAL